MIVRGKSILCLRDVYGIASPFICFLINVLCFVSFQLFPLNPDPRWQNSNLRPLALALQQALGQELARIRQGNTPVTGITARLLQAVAALINSPHSGALVMAMHRNHFISCPLMRQLYQYQVSSILNKEGWGGKENLQCIHSAVRRPSTCVVLDVQPGERGTEGLKLSHGHMDTGWPR